jgi:hypothetical protein
VHTNHHHVDLEKQTVPINEVDLVVAFLLIAENVVADFRSLPITLPVALTNFAPTLLKRYFHYLLWLRAVLEKWRE